jgi:hypothetical protein
MNRNNLYLNSFPGWKEYQSANSFFPFSRKGNYKNPNYPAENWAQQKELYNSQRRKRYLYFGVGAGRLGDRHR